MKQRWKVGYAFLQAASAWSLIDDGAELGTSALTICLHTSAAIFLTPLTSPLAALSHRPVSLVLRLEES